MTFSRLIRITFSISRIMPLSTHNTLHCWVILNLIPLSVVLMIFVAPIYCSNLRYLNQKSKYSFKERVVDYCSRLSCGPARFEFCLALRTKSGWQPLVLVLTSLKGMRSLSRHISSSCGTAPCINNLEVDFQKFLALAKKCFAQANECEEGLFNI